jgi:signal transduction histidine kinase
VRVKQREADGEGDESSAPSVLVESGLALVMLEGLPTPLCLRDRQSRYVWANAAFRSAFGRAKSELIGKTDFDLLPHEQALLEQIRDERVFRDGQDLFFEDRASYPSTLVGISGWHLPVRRPNHDAVEYVLRQWGPSGSAPSPDPALTPYAEESVRLLKEQQSELLKKERLIVLGQLAGSLAHQIRNPLGAISNAVAVLRRQVSGQTTPSMEQALDIAQEEVWVANRIIADLLAYSRIRPPAQRGIGVQELVEAVLGRETVPEGVSIDQRLGGERVYVDSGQVADAIANVIRNACEAMDGEGTLTIASRRDEDWVELSIADTGVGISQEEIALLFEPLITSKPLGIGLGLTTARALVANQGGTLECEGEPGKGARFKLRLPTGVTPPREPSSPSSPHVQSR